jgi:hypothetical protein
MEDLRVAIYGVLEEQHPATCRGLFYALVSRGVIPKTESAYKSIVVRLTGEMRRAGTLPYSWLADSTRWMRKPRMWDGVDEVLYNVAATYRRDLWSQLPGYVEVWLEKDALAGTIYDVTESWGVPLMVTRGYASLSFLASAADTMRHKAKPTTIYYLGDHDPSGVDIPRQVERSLREMAPEVPLDFVRLAVNVDQIATYDLPTRPTKRTDSRSAGFVGGSVEVDAMPSPVLRSLVEEAITAHVDSGVYDHLQIVEQEEREMLHRVARGWGR